MIRDLYTLARGTGAHLDKQIQNKPSTRTDALVFSIWLPETEEGTGMQGRGYLRLRWTEADLLFLASARGSGAEQAVKGTKAQGPADSICDRGANDRRHSRSAVYTLRRCDVDRCVGREQQSKPAAPVCRPRQPYLPCRRFFLPLPRFKPDTMVLLALYPLVSDHIISRFTLPRLCEGDRSSCVHPTIRHDMLYPRLHVSHLRLLRRCLHYRDHRRSGWKGPLGNLNQGVCKIRTGRRPLSPCPDGKGE